MRRGRLPRRVRAVLLAAVVVLLAPTSAAASDLWLHEGGTPGVAIIVDGRPVASAQDPASAIRVDPGADARLSLALSPSDGTTWDVRSIEVGLLVRGPDSPPPEAFARTSGAVATVPPGWTAVVNRTLPLASLERVGSGAFLMEAEVFDASGASLDRQTFYVRIDAGLAGLLTVQGAVMVALSAAAGYGLWQVLRDLKEIRDAWKRHHERAREDVLDKAEHVVEDVATKAGRPLAAAVDVKHAAGDLERKVGPVKWTMTGLGLGGVALCWAQYLGLVAFDVADLLLLAVQVGAAFLVLALVATAIMRRARASGVPQG